MRHGPGQKNAAAGEKFNARSRVFGSLFGRDIPLNCRTKKKRKVKMVKLSGQGVRSSYGLQQFDHFLA
jgi:hypothetical protein